jgi:hypothetical protein
MRQLETNNSLYSVRYLDITFFGLPDLGSEGLWQTQNLPQATST